MDFRLSTEQQMLKDGARGYLAERHESRWPTFAELGWLAMPASEDDGGLGSSVEDIAILCEELGRALAPEPFVASALLPIRILERCATHQDELLAAIIDGSRRVAVALSERNRRYDWLHADTSAARDANGFALSGAKTLVSGGAEADCLLVSATLPATGKLALFRVEANHAGIAKRTYSTIDGMDVADFRFDQVRLDAAALLCDDAAAILERGIDEALVFHCADALGCMDRAIEMTAEYLKLRKQFGKTLAGFQALQHTMAEMFIEADSARSIVYKALAALRASRDARRRAVAACRVKCMGAAKWVAGTAIHLHGGIGVTCEYPVGHYLRRIVVAERSQGDEQHFLDHYLCESATENL